MKKLSPQICFLIFKILGFGLLFATWLLSGDVTGFFLILFLIAMSLLRRRVHVARFTIIIDIIVCTILATSWEPWEYSVYTLGLLLFQAIYLGVYPAILTLLYLFYEFSPLLLAIFIFSAICGLFLRFWNLEFSEKFKERDKLAEKYYELDELKGDLSVALTQVEQMTAVAERARISRDIHDNAGHEIVAAYISFQTARQLFEGGNADKNVLELYDLALGRLDSGVNKIREAVHNMSTIISPGVEKLQGICESFPVCDVEFNVYGDTSKVAVHAWLMLESCLNESLTNVLRHSKAKKVTVNIDATPHLIRLLVENDGSLKNNKPMGRGLRNLRHRAAAIGGTLSVDAGEVFRVICVIPINNQKEAEAEDEIIAS
ncbi:MAG: histidine kinase [Defluviitaleaceae bacterium]|nr:histidine kinase [Defluviitaleaceae bacterium]